MEAFLVSTGIVALGEMGDKTQLLALLLAARFRKPVPIVLGILVATLANHAGAAALGAIKDAPRESRRFLSVKGERIVPTGLQQITITKSKYTGQERSRRVSAGKVPEFRAYRFQP